MSNNNHKPQQTAHGDAAADDDGSSHSQILKSSSIVGGSQAFGMVIGIVRTKLLAVILGASGPAALGLLGVFTTLNQLVATLVNLGVNSSGVREISLNDTKGLVQECSSAVTAIRRLLFVLGLLGSIIMYLAAPLLSQWSFGNLDHTLEIRILSFAVLLSNIAAGQTCILQGRRLLKDLAVINIWSALFGTIVSLPLYWIYGIKAVVPGMLSAALISCLFGWYFSRRHHLTQVTQSWSETLKIFRRMISLGFAFLGAGLLALGTAWLVQSMIARDFGQTALGNYSAAFRISGFLVSFVLGAMTMDFFPRLSGVSDNHLRMRRLINEQIEIGALLCTPPLVAMLCFADWLVPLFYSNAFEGAVPMFRWLVLGCLGRVFAWPLGAVFVAKGASFPFLFTEIIFAATHIGLVFVGMRLLGPLGAAIAFFGLYVSYFITMHFIMRCWIGFRLTAEVQKIVWIVTVGVLILMIAGHHLPFMWKQAVGIAVSLAASLWALRALGRILGKQSRIASALLRIPGAAHAMRWNRASY